MRVSGFLEAHSIRRRGLIGMSPHQAVPVCTARRRCRRLRGTEGSNPLPPPVSLCSVNSFRDSSREDRSWSSFAWRTCGRSRGIRPPPWQSVKDQVSRGDGRDSLAGTPTTQSRSGQVVRGASLRSAPAPSGISMSHGFRHCTHPHWDLPGLTAPVIGLPIGQNFFLARWRGVTLIRRRRLWAITCSPRRTPVWSPASGPRRDRPRKAQPPPN